MKVGLKGDRKKTTEKKKPTHIMFSIHIQSLHEVARDLAL